MKMASLLIRIKVAVFMSLVVSTGLASLQQYHDPSAPSGTQIDNITVDTITGLEWLDWDATLSVSHHTILANNGPSQLYEGWSYATRNQVRVLLEHMGWQIVNFPNGAGDLGGATVVYDAGALYHLTESYLGATNGGSGLTRVAGQTADIYTSDPPNNSVPELEPLIVGIWESGHFGTSALRWDYLKHEDSWSVLWGNALIRPSAALTQGGTVPEMSSIAVWLLLSGFAVTFYRRRGWHMSCPPLGYRNLRRESRGFWCYCPCMHLVAGEELERH